MKTFNEIKIISVDHGYGNIKTANHCFRTGITAYDSEPLFTKDMLVYGGKFYLIGEGHKEFLPDKIKDEDYYALTLVAIAKELSAEDLTEATVHIAAGLPLTWTAGQKPTIAPTSPLPSSRRSANPTLRVRTHTCRRSRTAMTSTRSTSII